MAKKPVKKIAKKKLDPSISPRTGKKKLTREERNQVGKKNLKSFVKGDPRINRGGRPKKLPVLKKLMEELLGGIDGDDLTNSELAAVVKNMISTAKSKNKLHVVAGKEILDRAYGKSVQKEEVEVTMKERGRVADLFPFKDEDKKKTK